MCTRQHFCTWMMQLNKFELLCHSNHVFVERKVEHPHKTSTLNASLLSMLYGCSNQLITAHQVLFLPPSYNKRFVFSWRAEYSSTNCFCCSSATDTHKVHSCSPPGFFAFVFLVFDWLIHARLAFCTETSKSQSSTSCLNPSPFHSLAH